MSATQTVTRAEQEHGAVPKTQTQGASSHPEPGSEQRSFLTEQGRPLHRKGHHSDKPAAEVVVSAPALATRSGAQAHKKKFLRPAPSAPAPEESRVYPELPEGSEESPRVDVATSMHSTLDPIDPQEAIVTQSETDWPKLVPEQPTESAQEGDKAYDLNNDCPTHIVDQEYEKVFTAYERHLATLQRAFTYLTNMQVNFAHRFMDKEEVLEAQLTWERVVEEARIMDELNHRRFILEQRNSSALTRTNPLQEAKAMYEGREHFLHSLTTVEHLAQVKEMIKRHTPGSDEESSKKKQAEWHQDMRAFMAPTPIPSPLLSQVRRRPSKGQAPQPPIPIIQEPSRSPPMRSSPEAEQVFRHSQVHTSTPVTVHRPSQPSTHYSLPIIQEGDSGQVYSTPAAEGHVTLVNQDLQVTQPAEFARVPTPFVRPDHRAATAANGIGHASNFSTTAPFVGPIIPGFTGNSNPFYTPGVHRPRMATRLLADLNDPAINSPRFRPPLVNTQAPAPNMVGGFKPRYIGPQPVPSWGHRMGQREHENRVEVEDAAASELYHTMTGTLGATPAHNPSPRTTVEPVKTTIPATTVVGTTAQQSRELPHWSLNPRFQAYNIAAARARIDAGSGDPGGNPGPGGGGGGGDPTNPSGGGGPGGPPGGGPGRNPGGGGGSPDPSDSHRGSPAPSSIATDVNSERLRLLEEELRKLRQERQDPMVLLSGLANLMSTGNRPRKSKVAPLKLAEFKGDHVQWPEWWDLFYSLIHQDKNFTDTEKVAYIYEHLPDGSDARNTVAGYRKLGSSYEAIVNRLKIKYGQKSRLLAALVQNILYAPAADSADKAQKLLDKFWGDTRSLQSYGVPLTDPCTSIMLITVLQSKMPKKISEQWEVQMTEDAAKKADESQLDQTIPFADACPPVTIQYTVQQFLTFCEERIRAMLKSAELAHSNKVLTTPKTQGTKTTTPTVTTSSGAQVDGSATLSRNQRRKLNRQAAASVTVPAATAQALVTQQAAGASKNATKKASQKAAKEAASGTQQTNASGQPVAKKVSYQHYDSGCFMCGAGHSPEVCPKRSQMHGPEKWDRIRHRFNFGTLCQRCFSTEHKGDVCPKGACGVNGCTRKHHPILHMDKATPSA
jgi:hypothetical protein